MTLVKTPMIASHVYPALTAALNTYHLAMNPASGGNPPSDSRKIVINAASAGMIVPQAGVVADAIVRVVAVLEQHDHAERPEIGQCIRQQVEEHRALRDIVPRDQREQQVAAVRD